MILIVEDDPQVARLIELVLRRHGEEAEVVADGETALSRVREEHPQMVIADLGLKGLSGDQLCRSVKDDDATRDIPFIVLSGDRDIQEKAASCGADEFLGKPFEFEELTGILQKYADRQKTD